MYFPLCRRWTTFWSGVLWNLKHFILRWIPVNCDLRLKFGHICLFLEAISESPKGSLAHRIRMSLNVDIRENTLIFDFESGFWAPKTSPESQNIFLESFRIVLQNLKFWLKNIVFFLVLAHTFYLIALENDLLLAFGNNEFYAKNSKLFFSKSCRSLSFRQKYASCVLKSCPILWRIRKYKKNFMRRIEKILSQKKGGVVYNPPLARYLTFRDTLIRCDL